MWRMNNTDFGRLASNETKNDDFVLRQVFKRLERSCTVAVVLKL